MNSHGVLQFKLGLDDASAPRNDRLHFGVQFWVQLDPFVRHLIFKPPFVILKKRLSWIALVCAFGLSSKRQSKRDVHNGGLEVVRVDDGRDTSLQRSTRRSCESAKIDNFDHFIGETSGHPNCV